ncbi:DNA polymerase III subunit epsilon [Desulfolithobacter dissulfuricans]|uniref:DNA polymerase III subunit epsilon n=1 Tax=Desulfolithobacter dissulfuricans TaxID=2795293 RepID=A0A915XL50_9BACT|nr:3'-5' exonuclease [Desulfolithobacter dissulfuricans]BCO10153.1 DNA polymerase III subunit epsilon [Desulfolithobacter dissulfuricans]
MKLFEKIPWLRKPHPVIQRNRELFAEFSQARPLGEYTFVVCDTELTGLNRRRDEIISIGAVRIVNLQIELSQTFHEYIRPENIDPNEATLVHRITPQQLVAAPPMEEVLPRFVEFLGDALLVGHFVGIDMHFLNKACRRTLGGTLSNPSVDTMRLARGYKEACCRDFYGRCDTSTSYNLDDLSREFNLPRFKPHDALEDALQTAYLFLFLVKKLKDGGIRTLKDLYRSGRTLGLVS